MTIQEFSKLIDRAEQIVATLDKWGGIDGIANRIDLIDEFLNKMDAKKDILIQLEKMSGSLYLFKALLTVDEAAAYLNVHRSTVYKLIKTQGLATYNPPSTKMLVLTENLVEWCKLYPNGVAGTCSNPGTQKKKGTRK